MMDIDTMISVLEAFKAGKAIQVLDPYKGNKWIDRTFSNCDFNFAENEYRVKPEPREFWLRIYPQIYHNDEVHKSKIDAENRYKSLSGEVIKVREVLDDHDQ